MKPFPAVQLRLPHRIPQEKSDNDPRLTDRLKAARQRAESIAHMAGSVQRDCGLQIDPAEYTRGALNFGLAEVVYEWAKGTAFSEICPLTDVMEGSIVRTIVRLEQLSREFLDAARVMGDARLYQQMEKTREAIRRDVIFAQSLYIQ